MASTNDPKSPSWNEFSGNSSGDSAGPPTLKSLSDAQNESADPSEHPDFIGRYQILKQLGRGGFGYVYLANDPELHRHVAIKVPRWDRKLTETAIDRYLNEGKLLAQIEHPSIVAVHDLGMTENGVPFVVMQYIEGKTLGKLIKSDKLSLRQSLTILMNIAVGLREAHKETIVHRDFKPSNVIIDSQGGIHLVDFGMALHDDLTVPDFQNRNAVGTPHFMSPEQLRGENHRIDGRTDIWAFGVTMYLMMTGHMPFKADSRPDLTKAICYRNARPPRQLNDAITRELERICMRCLSKLMDDRYQSMADLIDELQPAVESGELENLSRPRSAAFDSRGSASWSGRFSGFTRSGESISMSADSFGSVSGTEPLQIIPKGLRSFDENDHEFFLQLLPGSTDRLGVPESVRFWTGRMGIENQVDDIPIGIIYGPSGCGKSSFVRAGLIPRLSVDVVPVYVDCTSPDVPGLIVDRLYRAIQSEPPSRSLTACIRQIRQDADESEHGKVVLVLDQFEQWLEHTDDYAQQELTEALRQCDSKSIQCLILVRDDFWMRMSSFMKCLERPIEEGRNAAALPLFDRRHATRVLKAYGRSVGALPPATSPLGKSQKRFIREAVDSIAENNSVLCVRLTILADMIADQDWGNTSFSKLFGNEGIGSAFLERHLTDNVKVSKSGWLPACEVILGELLPSAMQTELKASERKRSELRKAVETEKQIRHFDECLDYLTQDLKLVSRVESELPDAGETAASGEAGYRLTHDFFVVPIRQWLRRRQSKSAAGRTRVRFNELSSQYQIARNRRYLPNPVEYLMTCFCVKRQSLDAAGKDLLSSAHRYYATRLSVVAALIAVAFIGLSFIWKAQLARELTAKLFHGDSANAVEIIHEMQKSPGMYRQQLTEYADSQNAMEAIRSNAALCFLFDNPDQHVEMLLDHIEDAEPKDFKLFSLVFHEFDADMRSRIEGEHQKKETRRTAHARIAALLHSLGDDDLVVEIFEDVADPDWRTEFVDVFEFWHGDIDAFCNWLANVESDFVIQGAAESLAFASQLDCSTNTRRKVIDTITRIYRRNDHAGASGMLEYCARQWGTILKPDYTKAFYSDAIRETAANGQDQLRLIQVDGGTLVRLQGVEVGIDEEYLGAGKQVVIEPFHVSPGEVTIAMFKIFVNGLDDTDEIKTQFLAYDWWDDAQYADYPIRYLTPNSICRYLNWLSTCNDLNPAYQPVMLESGMTIYEPIPLSNGYRLPTSDETEFFTKAGGQNTRFSWGGNYLESMSTQKQERIVGRYQTIQLHPDHEGTNAVNQTAPNLFGIYESMGNVSELCHDNRYPGYRHYRFTATNVSIGQSLAQISIGYFVPAMGVQNDVTLGFRIARSIKTHEH